MLLSHRMCGGPKVVDRAEVGGGVMSKVRCDLGCLTVHLPRLHLRRLRNLTS